MRIVRHALLLTIRHQREKTIHTVDILKNNRSLSEVLRTFCRFRAHCLGCVTGIALLSWPQSCHHPIARGSQGFHQASFGPHGWVALWVVNHTRAPTHEPTEVAQKAAAVNPLQPATTIGGLSASASCFDARAIGIESVPKRQSLTRVCEVEKVPLVCSSSPVCHNGRRGPTLGRFWERDR